MTTVREATARDLSGAGRALAAAFADDPVWTWMAPERSWARRAPAFYQSIARAATRSGGQVFVDDEHRGAAVWAAPGEWKAGVLDVLRMMPVAIPLFGRNFVRALRSLGELERHHPTEPHWYLEFVGTHPDHQGTGIGSALVRSVTDRCDAEGGSAYLESSKESNIPFYARHGFAVREEIRLPGGPSVWPMWREAQR